MAIAEAPVRPRAQSSHQSPFINEPFFDFRHEDNARKMRAAIERVRAQLGREYDLIIGGQRVKTNDKIKSLNPSHPSAGRWPASEGGQRARRTGHAGRAEGLRQSWKKYFGRRARRSLLFRAADLMRQRKMDYMAWLVFEVSKNWGEADADISETIDFCDFYAREALRFAKAPSRRYSCPASTTR